MPDIDPAAPQQAGYLDNSNPASEDPQRINCSSRKGRKI